MGSNKPNYTGGCRCGQVSYEITGEPKWKVSCHCNWCQTTSGSAFRTFIMFDEADLHMAGDSLQSYEDTATDHGRPMVNQFCGNCGTLIGIKVPSMADRHISIGSLDQRADIDVNDNIWGTEALKFVAFPKDSDVYKTGYWNATGEKMDRD